MVNYENKKFVKIFKKRDLNSKLVRRRGRILMLIIIIQNLKLQIVIVAKWFNKKTWNNFQNLFYGEQFTVVLILMIWLYFLL